MPAPWDSVPLNDLLVVLVTGANSGIGMGIGQKLIDDFLAQRPPTSHLVLIPTTRSPTKSRETLAALAAHLSRAAASFASRSASASPDARARIAASMCARVHLLSIQLDLCDLRDVYAAADALVSGTLSNPPAADGSGVVGGLDGVRVPKIDAVIFNAGFGGWTGIDWWRMAKSVVRRGMLASCTWPDFKLAQPGDVVCQKTVTSEKIPQPVLGKVFCSNVFGHYVFAHRLIPLLTSPATARGRIIWTSSIEPQADSLSLSDIQGLSSLAPYESSKRLTDILSLTNTLPSVAPRTTSFFGADHADPKTRPAMYVTHPGVVASPLFPLAAWMFQFYRLTMYLCRLCGSPWHPVEAYAGSAAAVWLVLAAQDALDAKDAQQTKWGAAASRLGKLYVKPTEVDGWGWTAKAVTREDVHAEVIEPKILGMAVGRHPDATDATPESRKMVEEQGAAVWEEMERLRVEWEQTLGV
ncbi:hypothetical protein TD95_003999 [Thielaviopsis punctulata]|uniref:3-keto-steroid reductase n=1 Tax=Thielaviopsis punctulata TaxID=72032 RepID=A0A0F4Z9Y2_9PEZI|nr:hypothetical protein TD95_003999 [Thielaviopsis punctulata]